MTEDCLWVLASGAVQQVGLAQLWRRTCLRHLEMDLSRLSFGTGSLIVESSVSLEFIIQKTDRELFN